MHNQIPNILSVVLWPLDTIVLNLSGHYEKFVRENPSLLHFYSYRLLNLKFICLCMHNYTPTLMFTLQ